MGFAPYRLSPLTAVATIAVLVGCGDAPPAPTHAPVALVSIPTSAPIVPDEDGNVLCPGAAFGGELVRHSRWGVALRSPEGLVQPYVWPHGYVARVSVAGLELLDAQGEVIAREVDFIEGGGGEAEVPRLGQAFRVCPVGIEVTRPRDR